MIKERELKQLLRELKEDLQLLYGARFRGVYLYGSYARGEQEEGSDVDVLIVLDKIDHYAGEVDRSGQILSDLSLKFGVSVSNVFVSEQNWRNQDSFFLANVREEAIAA